MKAFNVSFYDDRRLCFMEGCTPSMLAFKWDHAVCAQLSAKQAVRTSCAHAHCKCRFLWLFLCKTRLQGGQLMGWRMHAAVELRKATENTSPFHLLHCGPA